MGRHKACCPVATPTPTQGPTPTITPTAPPGLAISCACWPQDIEGVVPDPPCEDPGQVLGYKHIGYGVCEAVTGCTLSGTDAGAIYQALGACQAAFADCACADCEPWPTPIPIPTATVTAVCDNCAPGTAYLDWHEWYPVDRGQQPGERAINWWSNPSGFCLFGQSTYNYPGIPKVSSGDRRPVHRLLLQLGLPG